MFAPSSSGPRVVPARLASLAIYNPALGPSDERVADQIVFYYSASFEANRERNQRADRANDAKAPPQRPDDDEERSRGGYEENHEENERLRQVGLAQGMVNFVTNFSGGAPLDSIETEKTRTVLRQVESDWWILATIDLTKLQRHPGQQKKPPDLDKQGGPPSSEQGGDGDIEYSSREVSPAHLLLSQLEQAYRIFLMHQAPSLSELWTRHDGNRDTFCSLLHKYWTSFARDWDVLLHGNPATDMFDAVKLAVGGELGVGVGEEEHGSGEREVLEDFAGRTAGLLDLLVARYGDAPVAEIADTHEKNIKSTQIAKGPDPWLGNGADPRAEDGIIFRGVGGISNRSIATISQWMNAIFMHGQHAYGVAENPSSRPRHRRKMRSRKADNDSNGRTSDRTTQPAAEEAHPRVKSPRRRAPDLRRKAMENNAAPPGIPAPLVGAVERSLDEALAKAAARSGSEAQRDDKATGEAVKGSEQGDAGSGSVFGTGNVMKYLSLGYGTSWTLNPKGFSSEASSETPKKNEANEAHTTGDTGQEEGPMEQLDPTPDVSDSETPFVQRLEQSIGKFLIGLSGDLENTEFELDSDDDGGGPGFDPEHGSNGNEAAAADKDPKTSHRLFLRTITVQMSTSRFEELAARDGFDRSGSQRPEPPNTAVKTSAAASVDGVVPNVTYEKVQVAVYVHQPFMFVFLFKLRTPSLTMPAFYRGIHHTLGPLQKSLLRSTDPRRWKERVHEHLGLDHAGAAAADSATSSATANNKKDKNALDIYDLVYDPNKSTVRTSIPSIPLPGSLAAEGLVRNYQGSRPVTVSGAWYTLGIPIGSSASVSASGSGASTPTPSSSLLSSSPSPNLVQSDWTRVEALNVHTHLLNIFEQTRTSDRQLSDDYERTVKTSRGWWIVWMRTPASTGWGPGQSHGQARGIGAGGGGGGGGMYGVDNGSSTGTSTPADDDTPVGTTEQAKEAFLVRRSPGPGSGSRDSSRSRSASAGRWLLRDQPRARDGGGANAGGAGGVTSARGVSEGVGVDARRWVDGLLRLSL